LHIIRVKRVHIIIPIYIYIHICNIWSSYIYPATNFGGFVQRAPLLPVIMYSRIVTNNSPRSVYNIYFPPNRWHSVRFSLQIDIVQRQYKQTYIILLYCARIYKLPRRYYIVYIYNYAYISRACVCVRAFPWRNIMYIVKPWKLSEWQQHISRGDIHTWFSTSEIGLLRTTAFFLRLLLLLLLLLYAY